MTEFRGGLRLRGVTSGSGTRGRGRCHTPDTEVDICLGNVRRRGRRVRAPPLRGSHGEDTEKLVVCHGQSPSGQGCVSVTGVGDVENGGLQTMVEL